MKHIETKIIIGCLLVIGVIMLSLFDYLIEHYPVFSLFSAAFVFMCCVLLHAGYKKINKFIERL